MEILQILHDARAVMRLPRLASIWPRRTLHKVSARARVLMRRRCHGSLLLYTTSAYAALKRPGRRGLGKFAARI